MTGMFNPIASLTMDMVPGETPVEGTSLSGFKLEPSNDTAVSGVDGQNYDVLGI